jgi:hypothetical protein
MIYVAMALDFPAWAYKAINKLCRDFFWRGRNEAKGGHCHVAWGCCLQANEARWAGYLES